MSKRINERFRAFIMYFTLNETEEREHQKYLKEYNRLFALSESELTSRLINSKATYNYKKNILSFYLLTVVFATVSSLSSNLYRFIKMAFTFVYGNDVNSKDIMTIGVILASIALLCIVLVAIIVLCFFLSDLRALERRKLMIEHALNEKTLGLV